MNRPPRGLFGSLAALACMTSAALANPMQVELRRLPDAAAATTKFLNPEYVLASPAAAKATDKTPLLIFLHGAGDRGTDLTTGGSRWFRRLFRWQRES